MRIIASIEDPIVIQKVLAHLDKKGAFSGNCLLPDCRALLIVMGLTPSSADKERVEGISSPACKAPLETWKRNCSTDLPVNRDAAMCINDENHQASSRCIT